MTQTDTPTQATPDHPAKWSDPVLAELYDIATGEATRKGKALCVLDPFAGVGRARLESALGDAARIVQGVELQELWVVDPLTQQGDATDLWQFDAGQFDAIFTSPCYGNRMADDHDNRDPCAACAGTGKRGGDDDLPPTDEHRCSTCKGSGLSRRNTYRHRLGRPLTAGTAANLRYVAGRRGNKYRRLHEAAWAEVHRVLRPYGAFLLNVSNHLESVDGRLVEHRCMEWHLDHLIRNGFRLEALYPISTRRLGQGANSDTRPDHEFVLILRKR